MCCSVKDPGVAKGGRRGQGGYLICVGESNEVTF